MTTEELPPELHPNTIAGARLFNYLATHDGDLEPWLGHEGKVRLSFPAGTLDQLALATLGIEQSREVATEPEHELEVRLAEAIQAEFPQIGIQHPDPQFWRDLARGLMNRAGIVLVGVLPKPCYALEERPAP